ncbi:hypothetical protein TRFO_17772 [Tritrichomonas foetus]|uniref:Nucleotide-diphospho-sugar transferase domain-containing protein n=1 Tax=Tritrichomonas foetus TaxID=1144522 RepID=A0A1J4KMM8_9EUKA|nr:hypothetical protein TRFO_17772 [Tritrichomonas foetus]|eukprot:OHT12402.1 hypothetical protein TRFO_17772 [Tritrichomonas foetus]
MITFGFHKKFILPMLWIAFFHIMTYSIRRESKYIYFISKPSINSLENKYYKLCAPFIKKKSFSTKRDLTITSIFYRERDVPLTLFSIRQSGCMATIVILTNKGMKFAALTTKIINCLSIKVIGVEIPHVLKKRHTDFIRDSMVCNFAKKYQEDFDRIFFFDAYDVFFEHDPFEYFIGDNMFFFQEALIPIKDSPCNRGWILDCYGNEGLPIMGDNVVICSGTVAGSIRMFIRFYELLQKQPAWKQCAVDQGQMNFAVYSGLLTLNNVSYVIFNHAGPVHTLPHSIIHYKYYLDNPNYIYVTNANDKVAAVYHQINRFKNVTRGLYHRCNFTKIRNACQCDDKNIKNYQFMNLVTVD